MALGKNIKKDKLIPSKAKAKEVEKAKPEIKEKKKVIVNTEAPVVDHLQLSHKTIKVISEEAYAERERIKAKFAEEIKEMQGKKIQLIEFYLGGSSYSLEIRQVREVVKLPEVTSIPHVPDYVMGVATIKGEVIAVVDLAKKFGIESEESSAAAEDEDEEEIYALLIGKGRNKIAAWVGRIPGTVVVKGESISSSTNVAAEIALNETYIKGFVNHKDGSTVLLDALDLLGSKAITAIAEMVK